MVDWEEFYASFRKPGFIPGYEIQNHLGGGAFGEVYKARKSSIGKAYAVKFLRLDEGTNEAAIERELDSVRLFASIDHPNLVTIEDMGVVSGVPYLIMGYAGEDTLARRLKRGDLDRESALRYFVQACRGVVALHDRRLAHFDLKPGNVFIKGDVARVGDYGLAKLLTEGRQTLSFGRGTPRYMAPEMLKNRADHRADVYSLGVILYESIAHRLPYEHESQTGMLIRENDDPPSFPADFPIPLRHVVERCLRLDPEHRFASVHELLEELGQTSRQGDSVRFDFDTAAARTGTASSNGAGAEPRTPSSTEELKVAAAELARGAAGVARGVWAGVRGRVGAGSAESPRVDEAGTGAADPPDGGGGEVVSFGGLEDTEEHAGAGVAPRPVSRALVREAADPIGFAFGEGRADGGELALATGSTLGTIPVPPRAEGGFFGSIGASLVLGAEILGAIVTGPALYVVRRVGRLVDRVVRGVPGLLGAALRLGLFVILFALLGGLFSFLLLAGIFLNL